MNRIRAAARCAGTPQACDQLRAIALLVSLACVLAVSPARAQTRTAVQALAQVLPVPAAPHPATVSAWVREWRLSGTGAPEVAHTQLGRVAGEKRIESEIWTATLAEQCSPGRERSCGVLVTVVFARN